MMPRFLSGPPFLSGIANHQQQHQQNYWKTKDIWETSCEVYSILSIGKATQLDRMAPKRKNAELKLKSIWDESLISTVIVNPTHRAKLWNHLILSNTAGKIGQDYKLRTDTIEQIPFANWCVPKKQAQRVVEEFSLFTTKVSVRSDSSRGDTTKLLVQLQDGHQVETVIMRHVGHATACISSQIGCQMGCR